MSSNLQFSELSVVYGGHFEKVVAKRKRDALISRIQKLEGESGLPSYEEVRELEFCKDLKVGQKLRVVDGILKVDKRIMQCVARSLSKDNRHKTLEHLKVLCEKYKNNLGLARAIETLKQTYKYDDEFVIEGFKSIKELDFCKDLKEGQKLRVVDGELKVDKRIMQCVARALTKDNRNKTLKHLEILTSQYERWELRNAIKKLKATYKDDDDFIRKLNILDYSSNVIYDSQDETVGKLKKLEWFDKYDEEIGLYDRKQLVGKLELLDKSL